MVKKSEMGRVSSHGKSLGKCQSYGKSWELLVFTARVWLMLCKDNRDSVSWSQHEMALRNRAYLGGKTNDAVIRQMNPCHLWSSIHPEVVWVLSRYFQSRT